MGTINHTVIDYEVLRPIENFNKLKGLIMEKIRVPKTKKEVDEIWKRSMRGIVNQLYDKALEYESEKDILKEKNY